MGYNHPASADSALAEIVRVSNRFTNNRGVAAIRQDTPALDGATPRNGKKVLSHFPSIIPLSA